MDLIHVVQIEPIGFTFLALAVLNVITEKVARVIDPNAFVVVFLSIGNTEVGLS
jgi:hypothetical protein